LFVIIFNNADLIVPYPGIENKEKMSF